VTSISKATRRLTKKACFSLLGTIVPRLRHRAFETVSTLTQRRTQRRMRDTVADSTLGREQSAEEEQQSRAQLR
jgi:hypothetical protein